MAKIPRVFQKIFASNSADSGVFGSAQAGTFLKSTSIATLMGLPAWLNGWFSATLSGQYLPTLEETQAVDYVVTTQLAYLFQEGVPEYDASTTYYIGSMVKKTGTYELYGSVTNDNTGNALTDGTKWTLLINLASNTAKVAYAAATGVDTITATYSPAVSLVDGQFAILKSAGPNTVTTPTFAPNALTAHTITARGGAALAVGDTGPANYDMILCYNLGATRWELLNPAKVLEANLILANTTTNNVTTARHGLQPILPNDATLYMNGVGGYTLPAQQAGEQVGFAQGTYTTNTALSADIPYDDTVPQSGEGTEIIALAYTPKYASSLLEYKVDGCGGVITVTVYGVAIFRDSATSATNATGPGSGDATSPSDFSLSGNVAAGSTSSTVFRVRVGPAAGGGLRMNGTGGGRIFGGAMAVTLTIREIRQ